MTAYAFREVVAGERAITADINENATTAQNAMNSFPGDHIESETIPGDRIKANSLPGSKLVNSDVDADKLASGSVTETKIGALAVTTTKLADLGVTTGKIALAAVGVTQLTTGIMRVHVDTYTGDTTGSHAITGVGFLPKAVLVVKANAASGAAFRLTAMTATNNMATGLALAQGILSLDSDGFTVGTAIQVNQNNVIYAYIAIGTT